MSNNTVSVRMLEDDKALLARVCKARGEDVSDFVWWCAGKLRRLAAIWPIG